MQGQNIIGSAVRSLRVGSKLTQEELAIRCQLLGWDLSRETLSKIEAGLRRVNDAEVWMMARGLRCDLEDLYPGKTKAKVLIPVLRHSRSD
jgi:transcriptional regulator with XRE-family HTH domain